MGEVRIKVTVLGPQGGKRKKRQAKEIETLVDTGATLPVLPGSILDALGVQRVRKVRIHLADGRVVERDVGNVELTVNGDTVPCRAVFGTPQDASVLGLTALEQLGLAVDPVRRRLVPVGYQFLSASPPPCPSPIEGEGSLFVTETTPSAP